MHRSLLLGVGLFSAATGCFKPVGPSSSRSSSGANDSASGSGASAGAVTGSASAGSRGATAGPAGSVGSAGPAAVGTSGAATIGVTLATAAAGTTGGVASASSTGGTTGAGCSVASLACPGEGTCELSVTPCPESSTYLSSGGICTPPPACQATNSCLNTACTSDADCPSTMACTAQGCEPFGCPALGVFCPSDCQVWGVPHSCDQDCICPTCSATTSSTSSTAGTAGSSATSGSSSTGGTSGSTGTTNSCSVTVPCASGYVCDVSLAACPGSAIDVSDGGSCQALPACAQNPSDPNGCQGAPCSSDADCGTYQGCTMGTCEPMICSGLVPACDPGCTLFTQPHTCQSTCVCPTCPGSAPDAGGCAMTCGVPFTCCGDTCVYLESDTQHCGMCTNACSVGDMCSMGSCLAATCDKTTSCGPDGAGNPTTCCGSQCCGSGQICCLDEGGGPARPSPSCFDASKGCPLPCLQCN